MKKLITALTCTGLLTLTLGIVGCGETPTSTDKKAPPGAATSTDKMKPEGGMAPAAGTTTPPKK